MKIFAIGSSGVLLTVIATLLYINTQEEQQRLSIDDTQDTAISSSVSQKLSSSSAAEKVSLPGKIELPKAIPLIEEIEELAINLATAEDHLNQAEILPMSAWSAPQPNTSSPSFNVSPKITVKKQIAFNANQMGAATKGDKFSLPMPNGEEYVVEVEKVSTFNNGTKSWQGHIDGYGDQYPVVFTTGKKTTFATITTPAGSFTLEGVEGTGWIYENPKVDELSDPHQEDSLLIPSVAGDKDNQ